MALLIPPGYGFTASEFARVLLMKFFPERTNRESAVLLAFLVDHIHEYDQVAFSVRVGNGLAPDPTHLPGVQYSTTYSTQKRIDLLAMRGQQPIIVELKLRVTPAALGQVITYKTLYMDDVPEALEPELLIVGAYSDDDTLRAITLAGVTVYLYPDALDAGAPAAAAGQESGS